MFYHNFKYTLKRLLKDKMLIFWTFAFPLILGTFFKMAFSNIEEKEKLELINIAIVNNEEFENNIYFKEVFKNLSNKNNKERLFKTKYVSESKANNLLQKDKISGYIVLKNTPKVVVINNGINETIIKQVVDEISSQEKIIKDIINIETSNYLNNDLFKKNSISNDFSSSIYKKALKTIENSSIKLNDTSNKNLSYTMIEFYTLIAMGCLYGGILGMVAINQTLANMSRSGKRVAISPTSKLKLILSSSIASYLIQLIGVFLLFIYTIFILKVDYGNNLFYVIFLIFLGCLAGLSQGVGVATISKSCENTKTGILIGTTMLGCFLSGMMGITMKYIIDKNLPIINMINPANMITDAFYTLYYYSTPDRFYYNIISLLIFSGIMIFISVLSLRRKKYDSI